MAYVHVRDRRDVPGAVTALRRVGGGDPHADPAALRVSAPVDAGAQRLVDAVRELTDEGVAVDDIALRRPTLDEVFLSVTGGKP